MMRISKNLVAFFVGFSSSVWAAPQIETFSVDNAKSEIHWTGGKRFVDSKHNGTVQVKSGTVTFEGTAPKTARIVIDMESIKNLDQKDPTWNEKLVGHLRSADFFDVEKFKEAKIDILSFTADAKGYKASANLTIRGITKPATFSVTDVVNKDGVASAKGVLVFDRRQFNVVYSTNDDFLKKLNGLTKDKIIADEIEIAFDIHAMKEQPAATKAPAAGAKK